MFVLIVVVGLSLIVFYFVFVVKVVFFYDIFVSMLLFDFYIIKVGKLNVWIELNYKGKIFGIILLEKKVIVNGFVNVDWV